MKQVNIALLQLLPTGTLKGNLEKGLAACRQAKAMGAHIALFPEMWSCGYGICSPYVPEGLSPDHWNAEALAADGDFTGAFGQLAKELELAIGITLLEAAPTGPRNSLVLFDRHGKALFTYAKVHTCDFGDEKDLCPGRSFYTASLDLGSDVLQVGAMICYDREFPESARILMLQGAELILVPNACPMEINRLSQLRARAFENMTAIATCNYPEGHPDCNGHSTVFDGVAYVESCPGSRDTCILEAGGAEGIYLAKLDLAQLRDYRAREVHGNAYRRPEMYGALLSTERKSPFLRDDYRH